VSVTSELRVDPLPAGMDQEWMVMVKVSHTRYRALGPELILVYRQSACR